MKQRSSQRVIVSSIIVIACLNLLVACGGGLYDITNATDREAMKIDIKNALTANNCSIALGPATLLYQSEYSDNDIRMLYASAHACNVGIQLYALIAKLSTMSNVNPLGDFAKFFPSSASDSRMPSSWFAQDALQAMLLPGAVLAPADQTYIATFNPGSVQVKDRTDDANVYMTFVGMAEAGVIFNLYGAPTPTYNRGVKLPWETLATVKADTQGVACALASSFLNFFDGAHKTVSYLNASAGSNLNFVLTFLETPMTVIDPIRPTWGGNARCLTDGFTQNQCNAAKVRLRYRSACTEQDPAASFAAGMIGAINDLWL